MASPCGRQCLYHFGWVWAGGLARSENKGPENGVFERE